MSLISRSVPSLFNGVSQQPAPLRGPTQCEESVNFYPLISVGLTKRPPSEHLAKLIASTVGNAYVKTLVYDDGSQYVVVITNGDIDVYRADGTACSVTITNATYLNCTDARQQFSLLQVSDFALITNKTVSPAMDAATVSGSLSGTKQRFSDLAVPSGTNQIWKVEGDNTTRFDNYYVKDTGTWVEWLLPGEQYKVNPNTMPHKLVKTGATTFTFGPSTWDDRKVGDVANVPNPSFIGRPIQDMAVHRNRLVFIHGEFMFLSVVGEFFDVWVGSATAVLDTDPIDTRVPPQGREATLRYILPFNKAMLAFSATTQFQFTGGDTLTPRNYRIDPITEFASAATVRPAAAGQEVFFAVPRGDYSAVRNYYIDTEALSNDASEITAHVPSYIPKDLFELSVSTTEDVLFGLSLQKRNVIYLYKWYWQEDKKAQSAWQRFEFAATDTILSASFINNVAYLVIERADGVYLESINLQPNAKDTNLTFRVLLDRRVSLTGSYSAVTDKTTFTLPYSDAGTFDVVLSSSFTGRAGELLPTTRPSNTTVAVDGDVSAFACYVGRRYEAAYTFSEIHFKDQNGLPVLSGRLHLRRMSVNYYESGYFRVTVTPKARETFTYVFSGRVIGAPSATVGVPSIASGSFMFPVLSENLGCTIKLINDLPFPSTFQTAEWTGEFTLKSQRQG